MRVEQIYESYARFHRSVTSTEPLSFEEWQKREGYWRLHGGIELEPQERATAHGRRRVLEPGENCGSAR